MIIMLNSIDLNDKSYDELLGEALAQIPLYTDEWTNFNVSDPGITFLQNLTAFNILQQENLSTVTEQIRRRLLGLVGYTAHDNAPATVLVQAPMDRTLSLPAHFSLKAGSLSFETPYATDTDLWFVKAVYSEISGEYRDITRLLDPKNSSSAAVFGQAPEAGSSLLCILQGEPEPGSVLRFWAQVPEGNKRVPFEPDSIEPKFADTRWQYYTASGWQEVEAHDKTHGFLVGGEITLTLGNDVPELFPETPVYGCAVRCLLGEHEYDTVPRLSTFSGNLFPMLQQRTGAASLVFDGSSCITIRSSLAAMGNIYVYCREEANGDYYAYTEASASIKKSGRFYTRTVRSDGVRIDFDSETFGCAPALVPDAVLVCCYDNDMLHHRGLGSVYGYENQIINLDLVSSLVSNKISVLAQLPADNHEETPRFRLIRPNCQDPLELCYSVLSEEGQLLIEHPSYGGTYELFLADCVTTQGEAGNIRPRATLQRLGGYDGTEVVDVFSVPSCGFGGATYESAARLRRRFVGDIRRVNTAVTAEDYETLAKFTPGLSVHKVKAVIFPKENLVKLVVKPYTEKERPKLSSLYLKQLSANLEQRRMLTTRIDLISPRYVRIDVNVKLFIKPHFEQAEEEIRSLLRRSLDYVTTDVPFGSWIRFGDIYDALSELPCVVRVDSLRLIPEDRQDITVFSSDFKLSDRALCYPGEIRLELNTFTARNR